MELTIDPPVQAQAPLRQTKLRTLRISVSNPDSLIAACKALGQERGLDVRGVVDPPLQRFNVGGLR